jgi:hypothetical protein
MNSSILTSDRATHLKIGMTAVLATTLVIVIGICAQPPGNAHAPAVQSAAGPTLVAKADRGLAATH